MLYIQFHYKLHNMVLYAILNPYDSTIFVWKVGSSLFIFLVFIVINVKSRCENLITKTTRIGWFWNVVTLVLLALIELVGG